MVSVSKYAVQGAIRVQGTSVQTLDPPGRLIVFLLESHTPFAHTLSTNETELLPSCQARLALTNCAKQPRKVMYDQSQWLIITIAIYILYRKERLGGPYTSTLSIFSSQVRWFGSTPVILTKLDCASSHSIARNCKQR